MSLQDDFHGELLRVATENNESTYRAVREAQAAAEQDALIQSELQRIQPLICGVMREYAQTFARTMLELGKTPTYMGSDGPLGPVGLGRFSLSGLRDEFRKGIGTWEKHMNMNAWPVKAFIKFGLQARDSRYEGPIPPRKTSTPVAIFIDIDGGIFSDSKDTRTDRIESEWFASSIEQYRKAFIKFGKDTWHPQVARYEVSDGFMAPFEDIHLDVESVSEQPLIIEWRQQLKTALSAGGPALA